MRTRSEALPNDGSRLLSGLLARLACIPEDEVLWAGRRGGVAGGRGETPMLRARAGDADAALGAEDARTETGAAAVAVGPCLHRRIIGSGVRLRAKGAV